MLKENLDVDATSKTAVCMNFLEEKRDSPVGDQLHLFVSYVMCSCAPHKPLCGLLSLVDGSESAGW